MPSWVVRLDKGNVSATPPAGLWTRDLSRAHRLAARTDAGQVYVNEYPAGGIEAPFGGFKRSGYDREKGIEGLNHYCQTKAVTVRL
jgi:aldehyde dehydrogenase (NAD+)